MTHKELVYQAARQLKRWRCLPICRELNCYTTSNEIPDVIGWTYSNSILFECKASRSDFLRDKEKPFRILPESGVGDFRFYLTNEEVIKSADELPAGWGCYEVIAGKVKHKFGIRYDNAVPRPLNGSKRNELIIMRSWIRRFVEFGKGEPRLKMDKRTKELFAAPWWIAENHEENCYEIYNNLNDRIMSGIETLEEANRFVRLPELYDQLFLNAFDNCLFCYYGNRRKAGIDEELVIGGCPDGGRKIKGVHCHHATAWDLLLEVRSGGSPETNNPKNGEQNGNEH